MQKCTSKEEIVTGVGAPVTVPSIWNNFYQNAGTGQITHANIGGAWVAIPAVPVLRDWSNSVIDTNVERFRTAAQTDGEYTPWQPAVPGGSTPLAISEFPTMPRVTVSPTGVTWYWPAGGPWTIASVTGAARSPAIATANIVAASNVAGGGTPAAPLLFPGATATILETNPMGRDAVATVAVRIGAYKATLPAAETWWFGTSFTTRDVNGAPTPNIPALVQSRLAAVGLGGALQNPVPNANYTYFVPVPAAGVLNLVAALNYYTTGAITGVNFFQATTLALQIMWT